MRHGNSGRKLGRISAHRTAMLQNMVSSLIEHERITTTVPRAKEARRMAEKVITLGKTNTLHSRRQAFAVLQNETLVKKLFTELGPHFAERKGGYTRLIRIGQRHGDNAEMTLLEFVDRVKTAAPVAPAPVAPAAAPSETKEA